MVFKDRESVLAKQIAEAHKKCEVDTYASSGLTRIRMVNARDESLPEKLGRAIKGYELYRLRRQNVETGIECAIEGPKIVMDWLVDKLKMLNAIE